MRNTALNKTILITCLNPFATRNILFTDVFKRLHHTAGFSIVLVCPDYKLEYFKKHFSLPRVTIAGIANQNVSRMDIMFRFIGNNSLDNRTRYIHQRRELMRDKKFLKFFFARCVAFLSHFPFYKQCFRRLYMLVARENKFAAIFEKHAPDMVFATDVFHDDDVCFLAEAHTRGIKTIGMVRSWDNITNKGLMRVKPDKLIVHNLFIQKEAVLYEGMREKDVFVSGMPQFDYYLKERRSPREDFFKRINLDPRKRLLMFAPHGNRFHRIDWHILVMLKTAMDDGRLPADLQVLVRFPPNDDVDFGDFVPDHRFAIDRPGRSFKEKSYSDREWDTEEMRHLADSLAYIDVLLNYNSSITIDAAAFDKPSVGIAFDGWSSPPDIYHSIARFMEYNHTRYLLETGGLWVVRNEEEMIHAITAYLQNPAHHKEERKCIVKMQTWKFDGKAGERIAAYLHNQASHI